jgi:hypothetical protein
MSAEEARLPVIVPVRFMVSMPEHRRTSIGMLTRDDLFVVAKDISVLIHKRKGSVAKCFGAGTRMLMYDGSVKVAEAIAPGDRLMGDDGTARTVLAGSITTGHGAMYTVKGDGLDEQWSCNSAHLLVVRIDQPPSVRRVHDRSEWCVEQWILQPGSCSDSRIPCLRSASFDSREIAETMHASLRLYHQSTEFTMSVADYMRLTLKQQQICGMLQAEKSGEKSSHSVMDESARGGGEVAPSEVDERSRGAFTITRVTDGQYFGFQVGGNHRILLHDRTVVHNCIYNFQGEGRGGEGGGRTEHARGSRAAYLVRPMCSFRFVASLHSFNFYGRLREGAHSCVQPTARGGTRQRSRRRRSLSQRPPQKWRGDGRESEVAQREQQLNTLDLYPLHSSCCS